MSKKNEIQKCVISVEDCIALHLEVGHTKEEWKHEQAEAAKVPCLGRRLLTLKQNNYEED